MTLELAELGETHQKMVASMNEERDQALSGLTERHEIAVATAQEETRVLVSSLRAEAEASTDETLRLEQEL